MQALNSVHPQTRQVGSTARRSSRLLFGLALAGTEYSLLWAFTAHISASSSFVITSDLSRDFFGLADNA